jgi:hypothetical protein
MNDDFWLTAHDRNVTAASRVLTFWQPIHGAAADDLQKIYAGVGACASCQNASAQLSRRPSSVRAGA